MQRSDRRTWTTLAAGSLVGLVVAATPAAAHTGEGVGGLWSGVAHPILGLDHVFAMVTVGIVAAVLARPLAVPGAFLGAMTLGGALGLAGISLPAGETAIALSVVALGAALVAGATFRADAALALVAVAGLAHGHAHGLEAPTTAHPVVFVVGFLAATAALHASGVGAGMAVRRHTAIRTTVGTLVMGAGVGLVAGVI